MFQLFTFKKAKNLNNTLVGSKLKEHTSGDTPAGVGHSTKGCFPCGNRSVCGLCLKIVEIQSSSNIRSYYIRSFIIFKEILLYFSSITYNNIHRDTLR